MAKERKIDLVILGLLTHEDLTGYDIKKQIDNGINFFWKGSFGSIYPALNDMEKSGLIKKKQEKTGGREKIFYHITVSGEKVLRSWLFEEQAANDLKYETLLKIYFGGVEKPEVTVHNIEVFEKQVKEELQILKLYKYNLEKVLDEKDHMNYYLTVTFGIDTYEAYLKWCTKAKKLLGKNVRKKNM
ncbi:PadR family transcriptional regulator [Butyrivibrio sp. XB500-5]|uniref:PadR family transcriptional regulator n=1 Tax=Butyrivibrio sp. XB500-5 TaxID=2364880 RepID=UPI000EAA83E7|nr:PadR family transcriptional regulator [Butyrivibrio sp. XB500-5]RKM60888.1 PadR family transcriptional regulator [Butyrivibrio sp. XB500-5]